MNYWLVFLPRDDMVHCIDIGTFGLGRKQTISNVKSGDMVACVVTKEKDWKLIALGKATRDYYVDDRNVFKKDGVFVDRFDFAVKRLSPEVSFMSLVGKMSFVTKPEYWPVYFKNGIVKLSEADWIVLERATTAGGTSR